MKSKITTILTTLLFASGLAYATGSTVQSFNQIRGLPTLTIKNGPRTLSMSSGTSTNTSTGVLIDDNATQTVINKAMSGSANTFTNIPADTALVNKTPIANGGTNLNAVGSANYLFGTDNAGTGFEHKALAVKANGATSFPKYLATARRDENGTASVTALDSSQSYVKLTSGGTPVTTINTIAAGVDGQAITIYNATGSTVTVKDASAALGTAADRINTADGSDYSLANKSGIKLQYDSGQSRWVLVGISSAAGANVSAATGTLPNVNGGTGGDSSAQTGVAHVASGTWSYSTVVNADVSGSAAITRSKLASGNNYRILANSSLGVMSENAALSANNVIIADANGQLAGEATLAKSRGGLGQDNSSLTFPSSGTVQAITPSAHGVLVSGSGATASVTGAGNSGQVMTSNGASADPTFQTAANAVSDTKETKNFGYSATVGSNILTLALKQADGTTDPSSGTSAVLVGFRSSTTTSAAYSEVSFTAASSVALGTTDSLGLTTAVAGRLYVYLVSDTTSEICASATLFEAGSVQSATAMTGGAETSFTTLYCNSAHTSKPIRLVGSFLATWTSGTGWSAVTNTQFLSQLSTQGMVTSQNASPVRVESARITCSGTASACVASTGTGCGWIASMTNTATGRCVVNFAAGTWSTEPTCQINTVTAASSGDTQNFESAPTTSSTGVIDRYSSAALANGDMQITCSGVR